MRINARTYLSLLCGATLLTLSIGVRRVMAMLRMPGSHADAVNLAVANASLFNGRPRYVTTYDLPPATAVFSLYGVVTYNGLVDAPDNRGRQVCLAPFDIGLSHALAVLRQLSDEPYLYVGSFRRGISISTGQFKCELYRLLDDGYNCDHDISPPRRRLHCLPVCSDSRRARSAHTHAFHVVPF